MAVSKHGLQRMEVDCDNLNTQEDAIKGVPELRHCPCGSMSLVGHSEPGSTLQEHSHTHLEPLRARRDLVNVPSLWVRFR
jgi:hypothetical protein